MIDQELKQEAYELRKNFGLSEIQAISFKDLFLNKNILIYHTSLDMEFSGMAIQTGEYRFILVNSNHPIGRQHFTICHELFHLYVDKNFSSHRCQTGLFDKKNRSEFEADMFASYFLLPEPGLLSMIPKVERTKDKVKISTIVKIEQYYGCSRKALANRLLFLNKVSSEYRDELCRNVKQSAQHHGYPIDLYSSGNEGVLWGNYGIKAKHLFDSGKVSEGHFASLMADIGIDIFENLEDYGD
ncbi:MAG: ImmA/IrrE family metallo-endopeptidase [Bacteroidales bacterium]|nr:ImmA/IrrE family metallo-endopeptidase [Bacteroidales bacterium]MCF8390004.1 ImmA/IrrE family metallo-endopeptidase [Bacteroidales bacterium]